MSAPAIVLAPEAHWGDASAALEDAVSLGLETDAFGVSISAPGELPLGSRETLPLVGVRISTFRDALRIPLHAALLVASCAETGELRTAQLVEMPDEPAPDTGSDPGAGASGTSFELDLFDRPGIPRRPGTWVVRVLLHDQQSNAVTIKLVPSPTKFHDPAADELVKALMRKPVLRPLNPRPALGPGLPRYEPDAETPPLPASPGVAFAVPRALLLEASAQLVVRGSFRARILPRDVRPPPGKDAEKLRGPRAVAVLPLTLLVTGTRRPGAEVTKLVIPLYQPLEGSGDELVGTGAFAFDYFALAGASREPQTLFFYAVAGDLFCGVSPCALVDPSALPGV